MSTFKDRYGYPLWIPIAGTLLLFGGPILFIAWLAAWNPVYIVGAAICYWLLTRDGIRRT